MSVHGETIHTCSYACERPECIRAQRDELATRLSGGASNAVGDWVLVPRAPTQEMLAATSWPGCAAKDYAHMIAASPQPPSDQPDPIGDIKVALEGREGWHDLTAKVRIEDNALLIDGLCVTPPAEAQPVGMGPIARSLLPPTSPPSAPVGVEAIVAEDDAAWALASRAETAGAERDESDDDLWWTLRIEQFKALAQHPVAENPLREALAYVGQRTDGSLTQLAYRCELWMRESHDLIQNPVPKQPAAVDEATVEGLKRLVRHLAGNSDFDFEAALAAHQGGRDDG